MFASHPLPPAAAAGHARPFDIAAAWQALHGHAGPGQPIALLHMGTAHTLVALLGEGGAPGPLVSLTVGRHKTARDFFRRDVPTPLELENAIASVEDEVYLAHRQYAQQPGAARAAWWSTDAHLLALAELAGVPSAPAMQLSLEAMERLFQRLAAVSEGRPAASEGLPESVEFATTLLLLRELMHHMPFGVLHLAAAA
ncbi:exopolyphosphatase/pppGpp-phosphohydrolase [Acidovorax soli]|uniref:Exopolyphosphatase/pppGpp-phosphohydrolase n=1 Tax=Acidovorax soli TaxID=592050 RepID=A0A7X0PK83_9BURK|nr:hypothetical protein [Acidovorax soli]MBB6563468.1 exopolyphosphatase/pppGpp-phosphohydrolase [Acidovorax soli]